MIRRFTLLAVLLTLGSFLAACTSSAPGKAGPSQLIGNNASGPYDGAGLEPPQPRPSFTLTDDTGKPFNFGTVTAKHPTLLYFGYTHCPDACPETVADTGIALSKVPAAIARETYVVFVSTDVKRDTAPVIKQWLSNFSVGSRSHWVGLHGTQAQIDAAQAAAHIMLAEDDGSTHSTQLLLYGPDDYARVSFLWNNDEQKQIEHDLPLVAKD